MYTCKIIIHSALAKETKGECPVRKKGRKKNQLYQWDSNPPHHLLFPWQVHYHSYGRAADSRQRKRALIQLERLFDSLVSSIFSCKMAAKTCSHHVLMWVASKNSSINCGIDMHTHAHPMYDNLASIHWPSLRKGWLWESWWHREPT